MVAQIPNDHPLSEMFHALVERTFATSLRLNDKEVIRYLGGLLLSFAHMSNVYRLQDINGRPLEEVGDMLYYADLRLGANSFSQEREVHKHIGDYTLFWTGVYPEAIPKMRASLRKDHLIDYVKQGKESYYIVSLFDVGEWREEAPVYRKLSDYFEVCMHGLYAVRQQWEQLARQVQSF